MKNLFKNFSDYGITNKYFPCFLLLIEFSQLMLAVEIIFPINFTNNFYFFFHFLNPMLYIEYIHHIYSLSDCKANHQTPKDISENASKDILINMIQKYFLNKKLENELCVFQEILFYICLGIIIILIISFAVLFMDFSPDDKSKEAKKKKNENCLSEFLISFLFKLTVNLIYFSIKTCSLTILTIISNFFVIPFFNYDNFNGIGLLVLAAIFSYAIYIGFSIAFLNYFFNCFNEEIHDKLTESTSEVSLFAMKVVTSMLINLRLSNKFKDFFKVFVLIIFLFNFYKQYLIFLKLNIRNANFYCLLFYLTLLIDRSVSALILSINNNININNINISQETKEKEEIYFYILHLITNIVLFILCEIGFYYKSASNEMLTEDNMNLKLLKILSNLLENTLKNPAHLGNKEVNSTKLKKLILSKLRLQLIDHLLLCKNKLNCFICQKLNFISRSFNASSNNEKDQEEQLAELAGILLQYGELMKFERPNGTRSFEDVQAFVILKVIYLLIVDKEKIHRVSYFIKSYSKQQHSANYYNFKFQMILENLYEKIIFYSFDEDNKNFILQKCVELNEEYFAALNLLGRFIEALSNGKSQSVKFIVEKNEAFGKVFNKIVKEMKVFQDKYKFKEPAQYYKYLWCYGIIFNANYDQETYLDSPENYDILDSNFHKNSNFILKYDSINFTWNIKKIPEIFVNRFGYEHLDLLGKNYESLFPSVLRDFEKKRLINAIMADNAKETNSSRLRSLMLDSEGFLRSVEISFEVLPFITENNFIVCHMHKIEDRKEDRILIANEKTEIIGVSKALALLFGLDTNLLLIFKDRINLNKLFKVIVDYRLDEFKEVQMNYFDYVHFFVNAYLNESGEATEFNANLISFYEQMKLLRKTNKLEAFDVLIKFDLVMKIDLKVNYYIFKLSDVFEENKFLKNLAFENSKKIELENEGNFDLNDSQAEENRANLMESISQTANAYTKSSVSSELFSSSYSVTGNLIRSNKKQAKDKIDLSTMILYFNFLLIFVGIIMMIYISSSTQHLINIFEINSLFRKFCSDFYITYIDLSLLINPINSFGISYDLFFKKVDLLGAKAQPPVIISNDFKNIIRSSLFNVTNTLFSYENDIKQLIQMNVGKEFFDEILNQKTKLYLVNGNLITNYFFENIKIVLNNLNAITKYKLDFYQIGNIKDSNPLELNTMEQLINNQIMNYNLVNEKFKDVGGQIKILFYDKMNSMKIIIYVILFSYLAFHVVLIFLSVFQIKKFLKNIKNTFQHFNFYSKREFTFLFNKIKYVKQLVNVESKPSETVGFYKIEKKKFSEELKLIKEKQKQNEKKKFRGKNQSNEEAGNELIEQALNLNDDKNDLKINFDYEFELVKKVKRFILFVSFGYLMFGIIVVVIFTNLFLKLDDVKIINENLIQIEDLSSNYLLNFKMNILLKNQAKNLNFDFVESKPDNFYQNFESFLKILEKNHSFRSVKDYYEKLEGIELCSEIVNVYPKLDTLYANDLKNFCGLQEISQMNFYGIYGLYIKNIRLMYLSYFQIENPTWDESVYYFLNEKSQKMNWIYFVFLKPFIYEIRDNLVRNIYVSEMNDLSFVCMLCFISLIFIDFLIFIMMKIYVINKITACEKNIEVISNSLMI